MTSAGLQTATLELLGREAAFARAAARGLLFDDHLAEDAVQQTWLALLEHPPANDQRVGAWFNAVCRNVARKLLRTARRSERRERLVAGSDVLPGVLDCLDRQATLRAVQDSVAALREPYRRTVRLRFYDGLKPGEIARLEGVPVATVHSRLQRAQRQMRSRLDADFGARRREFCLGLLALARDPSPATARMADVATGAGLRRLLRLDSLTSHQWSAAVAVVLVLGIGGWSLLQLSVWMFGGAPVGLEVAEGAKRPQGPQFASDFPARRQVAHAREVPVVFPDATGLRVSVVREADGTPAVGVVVRVLSLAAGDGHLDPATAESDEHGLIRFDAMAAGPIALLTDRLPPLDVVLEHGERRDVLLTVPRGIDVVGSVVDAVGAPVASASIWMSRDGDGDDGEIVALTDVAGRFAVLDVPPGRWLGALHAAHGPALLIVVSGSIGERQDVALTLSPRQAALSGRVLDVAGRPLIGALVRFDAMAGAGQRVPLTPVAGRSAEDGLFRLDGVAGAVGELRVRFAGFAPFRQRVELAGSHPPEITVELREGARVRGRVEHRDGRPAAMALVRNGARFSFDGSLVIVGADGSFELTGLPAGALPLVAEYGAERAGATIRAAAGDVLDWNPILAPGRTIRGQVSAPSGLPQPAWVTVIEGDDDARSSMFATDAQGGFSLQIPIGTPSLRVSVKPIGGTGNALEREYRPVPPVILLGPADGL